MNGKILDFSRESGRGLLRGEDGARYEFVADHFRSKGEPTAGMKVDYEISDGMAEEIYAIQGSGVGGTVADLAMGTLATVGQQIIQGDPDATVTVSPEQLREMARGSASGSHTGAVTRPESLHTCNDCGSEISSRADACLRCGGPIPRCVDCGMPLDLNRSQCGVCGKVADIPASAAPTNRMSVSCPVCHGRASMRHRGGPFVVALLTLLLISLAPTAFFSFGSQMLLGMAQMSAGAEPSFADKLLVPIMEYAVFIPYLWGIFLLWAAVTLLVHGFGIPWFLRPQYACSRCTHIFRRRPPLR